MATKIDERLEFRLSNFVNVRGALRLASLLFLEANSIKVNQGGKSKSPLYLLEEEERRIYETLRTESNFQMLKQNAHFECSVDIGEDNSYLLKRIINLAVENSSGISNLFSEYLQTKENIRKEYPEFFTEHGDLLGY